MTDAVNSAPMVLKDGFEIITPNVDVLDEPLLTDLKVCPVNGCDRKINNSSALRMHLIKSHGEGGYGGGDGRKKMFACPVLGCPRHVTSKRQHFFKIMYLLRKHYLSVHAEKRHVCGKCGKKFGRMYAMERHELCCQMLFYCTCGAYYTTKNSLQNHVRIKGKGHAIRKDADEDGENDVKSSPVTSISPYTPQSITTQTTMVNIPCMLYIPKAVSPSSRVVIPATTSLTIQNLNNSLTSSHTSRSPQNVTTPSTSSCILNNPTTSSPTINHQYNVNSPSVAIAELVYPERRYVPIQPANERTTKSEIQQTVELVNTKEFQDLLSDKSLLESIIQQKREQKSTTNVIPEKKLATKNNKDTVNLREAKTNSIVATVLDKIISDRETKEKKKHSKKPSSRKKRSKHSKQILSRFEKTIQFLNSREAQEVLTNRPLLECLIREQQEQKKICEKDCTKRGTICRHFDMKLPAYFQMLSAHNSDSLDGIENSESPLDILNKASEMLSGFPTLEQQQSQQQHLVQLNSKMTSTDFMEEVLETSDFSVQCHFLPSEQKIGTASSDEFLPMISNENLFTTDMQTQTDYLDSWFNSLTETTFGVDMETQTTGHYTDKTLTQVDLSDVIVPSSSTLDAIMNSGDYEKKSTEFQQMLDTDNTPNKREERDKSSSVNSEAFRNQKVTKEKNEDEIIHTIPALFTSYQSADIKQNNRTQTLPKKSVHFQISRGNLPYHEEHMSISTSASESDEPRVKRTMTGFGTQTEESSIQKDFILSLNPDGNSDNGNDETLVEPMSMSFGTQTFFDEFEASAYTKQLSATTSIMPTQQEMLSFGTQTGFDDHDVNFLSSSATQTMNLFNNMAENTFNAKNIETQTSISFADLFDSTFIDDYLNNEKAVMLSSQTQTMNEEFQNARSEVGIQNGCGAVGFQSSNEEREIQHDNRRFQHGGQDMERQNGEIEGQGEVMS